MNFASPLKFDIIMALRNGPLSVSEICKKVEEEQSAVSHNLVKLERCRILNVRREGKQRIYSLNKETVMPMLKIVERHVKRCCLGRCGR
jgi:DNA-binding transcriptional ArsR family regulator